MDWNDKQNERQIAELLRHQTQLLERIVAELAAIRQGQKVLVLEEAQEIRQLRKQTRLLKEIAGDLKPHLSFIKIAFGGNMAQGPVILNEGQTTVATVLYFDQSGQPMPSDFVPPAVTYTIDHPEIATAVPRADGQLADVDYVTAGVATLTASVTSAEGLALSDVETVTCVATVPPPPQLGSIKIDFSTPGDIPPPPPPVEAARARR